MDIHVGDKVVYWDRSFYKYGPFFECTHCHTPIHWRPRIEWAYVLKTGKRYSILHGPGSLRKSKEVRYVNAISNNLILGRIYKDVPGI